MKLVLVCEYDNTQHFMVLISCSIYVSFMVGECLEFTIILQPYSTCVCVCVCVLIAYFLI